MTASWGADPSATSHAAAQQKERAMNLRTLMQAGPARANELFAKLADTSDGALKTRERLFSELKAELELHCGLEEEHLFPVLRRNAETKGLVADAVKDNRELRAKLAELDALPKTDEAFPERLKELQRLFRQHARDDKKELLPAVQRALSEEQVQGVAERIEAGRAEAEQAKQDEAEERRARAREERERAEREAAEAEQARRAEAEERRSRAQHEREVIERQEAAERERVEAARRAAEAAQGAAVATLRVAEQAAGGARRTGEATFGLAQDSAARGLRAFNAFPSAAGGGVAEAQAAWMGWLGETALAAARTSQDVVREAAEMQRRLAFDAVRASQEVLERAAEGQRQFVTQALQGWMERNARLVEVATRVAGESLRPLSGRGGAGSGEANRR
jgi:hypothetical protein